MICIFPKDATDFQTNGLAVLAPISCEVMEELNGEYRLEMVHPYDEAGKWEHLAIGNVVRAPVPKMSTPKLVGNDIDGLAPVAVYRCTVGKENVFARMHAEPGIHGGACVDRIFNKEEVTVLSQEWVEVPHDDIYALAISERGVKGWIRINMHFQLVRNLETRSAEETADGIKQKPVRDQPFRIYRIVPELDKITVYAKHIFYDLQDNMILSYDPEDETEGNAVAKGILSNTLSPHGFALYSAISKTAKDIKCENVNPVDALLNADKGFCARYKAEIMRDWYDVYIVPRIGQESSIVIAAGKNLKSLTYDEDATETATRIIPTGHTSDGKTLYLPEQYIESPNAGAFLHPKYKILPVPDAVVSGDMTAEKAYEKMREAVQEEFDREADQTVKTITVDYIDLTQSEEYKALGIEPNVFLGDNVHVKAPKIKLEFDKRMTRYVYDCLLKRYKEITLGTPYDLE